MKRTICVFIMLGIAAAAFGQQQTIGFPPFGSFEQTALDTINRQNLNVHFSIPIVSMPSRGTNFQSSLQYDSLVWYKSGPAWAAVTNYGNLRFGWHYDSLARGSTSHSALFWWCDDYLGPTTTNTPTMPSWMARGHATALRWIFT